jgi:amino acid transporter
LGEESFFVSYFILNLFLVCANYYIYYSTLKKLEHNKLRDLGSIKNMIFFTSTIFFLFAPTILYNYVFSAVFNANSNYSEREVFRVGILGCVAIPTLIFVVKFISLRKRINNHNYELPK